MIEPRIEVLAFHPDNPASDLIEELYELIEDKNLRFVSTVDGKYIHTCRTGLVFSNIPISQNDANQTYKRWEDEFMKENMPEEGKLDEQGMKDLRRFI